MAEVCEQIVHVRLVMDNQIVVTILHLKCETLPIVKFDFFELEYGHFVEMLSIDLEA